MPCADRQRAEAFFANTSTPEQQKLPSVGAGCAYANQGVCVLGSLLVVIRENKALAWGRRGSLGNKKVTQNGLKNKTATLKPTWNVFGKCARIKIRLHYCRHQAVTTSSYVYVPGQIILTVGCARSPLSKKLCNQNIGSNAFLFASSLLHCGCTLLIRSHGAAQFACGRQCHFPLCMRCDWNFAITQPVIAASVRYSQPIVNHLTLA